MIVRRLGSACACLVLASLAWYGESSAQAPSAPAVVTGHAQVHAQEIDARGTGVPGAFHGAAWTAAAPVQMDFDILAGPLDLGGGTVTGAPYSAEAVNEVVQTLADGNRIVRSSTTAVYRDAAGRTRRELGIAIIGPLVAAPGQAKQVIITDPEKGLTYVLDPTTRTARKMPVPTLGATFFAGPATAGVPAPPPAGDVLFFEAAVPAPGGANVTRMLTTRRMGGAPAEAPQSLGSQTIEGVMTVGTRATMTIAAGQIGNERPLEIVAESWFSPELNVLVQSKQTDPRFGETSYRLTNIVRSDPDPSLFEIPSDYTVLDTPGPGDVIFRRQSQ